jgi:hydrogenase-4 component E
VVVVIETSFAKLRLYKIPEFTVTSFLLAVFGVVTFVFQRDFDGSQITTFAKFAIVVAVGVLLLEFVMFRSQDVWELLRLYAFGSILVAVLAFAAAATAYGRDLYVVPFGIGYVIRNLDVPTDVPSIIRAPSAVLLAIALSSFGFLTLSRLHIEQTGKLPLSGLAVSIAVVLVSFLLMIVRPYAPAQILGFLVLENGVTLASLVIAPSLPLILALLLLFDLFVGIVVFVVLVQYFGIQRTAITTDVLDRLRG